MIDTKTAREILATIDPRQLVNRLANGPNTIELLAACGVIEAQAALLADAGLRDRVSLDVQAVALLVPEARRELVRETRLHALRAAEAACQRIRERYCALSVEHPDSPNGHAREVAAECVMAVRQVLAISESFHTCTACRIEAEIGTAGNPHPVPGRFHTCTANGPPHVPRLTIRELLEMPKDDDLPELVQREDCAAVATHGAHSSEWFNGEPCEWCGAKAGK